MKYRFIIIILIFFTFFSKLINANEIPVIVISAGKSAQSYNTVGSDIEVISSDTLKNSRHDFLGDIINEEIPGANYFQSGGHGTQAGIQLRGLPKRYSTVYIDGVKMSDPSNPDNSFYISNIMKDSIDRVEILKGSQSSLYGSSAIGGTINIFTKKGNKENNTNYSYSYGSNNTNNLNASYGSSYVDHDFYFGINNFRTIGISAMNDEKHINDNDGYTNKSLTGNYGYEINNNLNFRGSFRYNDSFLEYDVVQTGTTDFNTNTDDNELSYNLRLNYEKDKFKNTIIYNYTGIERATTTATKTMKNYYGYRDAINFMGEYNFNLDNKIVYGLDNEFDRAKFQKDWPTDYLESDESIYSQYLDFQSRPFEKLYNTIGIRRDTHTTAGSFETYRGTLAYKIDNESKLRLSYGTGIRFPALYDYFYGTTVSNKEDLKPEKSKSFDIGYEANIEKLNSSFDVSFYHIVYEDALEGWQSHNWTVKNSIGEIKSKGVELSSLWKPSNKFNVSLNYSYTDTYDGADCDDPNTSSIDCAMVRVPRHNLNSVINYKTKNQINNKFLIKYSGEVRDYGNTNNSFADVILTDYITLGYMVDYNFKDLYRLSFEARNIFDEKYEQAYQYSTMGRSFNIGIKSKF